MLPFLKLRNPRPDSIKFITDFSRRTGDLEVMSKPDIHLLALCYELEIEQNGGDWRIRKDPTQRGLNGTPPAKAEPAAEEATQEGDVEVQLENLAISEPASEPVHDATIQEPEDKPQELAPEDAPQEQAPVEDVTPKATQEDTVPGDTQGQETQQTGSDDTAEAAPADEDDDSDGWITPSNLKKHQTKDAQVSGSSEVIQEMLQAALLTSDFAMQNVALRINLKYVHSLTYVREP